MVAPWKFDVLKTSIYALLVLRSNFRRATVSQWSLNRNTLLFNWGTDLYSNQFTHPSTLKGDGASLAVASILAMTTSFTSFS